MIQTFQTEIISSHNKPIFLDFSLVNPDAPVIVFCHGYKGFKDWGAWNLVSNYFAEMGYNFIKFNFSHNGGTRDQLDDFPDLEAFGNNNYSKELDDLGSVLSWIKKSPELSGQNKIGLIGHSRGGAISILGTRNDDRITSLVTWASVSDFEVRFPFGDELLKWKSKGVYHVVNGRTKQDMPHYFQFYTNFMSNRERLDIRQAAKLNESPFLILHGSEDEAVHFTEAMRLKRWCRGATLEVIDGASHTFGSSHPWESKFLPPHLSEACNRTLEFFDVTLKGKVKIVFVD